MTGHLNTAYLPPGYPQFFQRAESCRRWDVDGRAGRLPQRAHAALRETGRGLVARIAHAANVE
jgi:hypothetical protein